MINEIITRTETSIETRRLKIVVVILTIYLAVEIVAGYITGSLALIADALHMFADVFGISLVLVASIFSKKPPTPLHTYGFYRSEILSSLANCVILLLISIFIIFEAYRRIFEPHDIESSFMLIVAIIGLIVNLIGLRLLKGTHVHTDHTFSESTSEHSNLGKTDALHIQGAKLELFSDLLGSVAIIVGAVLIYYTDYYLIDSIISFGLALFIIPRVWYLLQRSISILMESSPSSLLYKDIKNSILQIRGATGVFDLHIWSITSGNIALSAHIVIFDSTKSQEILREINSLLEKKFGIYHTTIQIEKYHTVDDRDH
ncbi:MAG: cation diffusion facilitator family transporter [Candidatus Nitrosocosmicus sp.]|nr:cation diffusion facilitator family transporter [Candidatus Nitrosocosmicus sp.]MDN5866403.1 cation diffusion facilitator family transporter [Candidatus Nitrosocosmicus sp.]